MADDRTFVVIGGGQAGGWTARTLRDQGFEGRVVLLADEAYPPYERPPLSKEVLLGDQPAESTYLWPPDSWAELNVDLRLSTAVESIDTAAKTVAIAGGDALSYDRLMLATGARVRELPVPGADLSGVHYLRAIDDTNAIRADLDKAKNVVVIGGGWIGLEMAAAARKSGADVTVVEAAPRLCERALTPDMSDQLKALHEGHGVTFLFGAAVEAIAGDGGVSGVTLSGGETLPADLVVIGIGIVPNSELAEAAGIQVDNGIVVDAQARTSDPDVFAAGDVTCHPNPYVGRTIRLESWENAQNQGIAAAKAMLDAGEDYGEVPWFWSDQYDANIQLVGLPEDWDEEAVRGDRAANQFIVFYLKANKIVGAAAVNQGRDVRFARRLMQADKTVDAAALADPDVKLQALLKG